MLAFPRTPDTDWSHQLRPTFEAPMSTTCAPHDTHDHTHAPDCGHVAVDHGDHVDYLHDGHRHAVHGDHYDEH
jgi:hypothetical protein